MKKIAASLVCLLLTAASVTLADSLESIRKAPELSFTVPGQGTQLLSQYRGKVVALEFIFTTCPHCQAASKMMTKLQSEYGSRGLQVIDVAVNPNADLLVDNFAKDFQVNFPVGWTTQQQMQAFMNFPGYFVVPQLALIDRKGNIHYQTPSKEDANWDALMKEDAIRKHIEELLGSTAAASHVTHTASARKGS